MKKIKSVGAVQFTDSTTGLYLTKYREYLPAAGRWLSRDPIGVLGGQDVYAYVENNPINDIDLFGLSGPFGGYSFSEAEGIEVQQQVDQEEIDLAPHGGGAGFSGAADATTLASGQVSVAGAFLPDDIGLIGSEGVNNSTLGLYAGGGPFIFFTNATSLQQLRGCAKTTSYNTPWGSLQITTSGSTWVLSIGIGPSTGFSASSYRTYTAQLD